MERRQTCWVIKVLIVAQEKKEKKWRENDKRHHAELLLKLFRQISNVLQMEGGMYETLFNFQREFQYAG